MTKDEQNALPVSESQIQLNLLVEKLQVAGLSAADFKDVQAVLQALLLNEHRLLQRIEELQVREERLRIVADNTYDWEYWILPEGRLEYCSPSCKRITGYDVQEYLADPGLIDRIVHPEDAQVWKEHRRAATDEHAHRHDIFRIINRTGDEVWISHHCVAVFAEDGTYLGRRASNRDISSRKRAETALWKKSEELELYFKSSLDLLCIANIKGQFIRLNTEWERVLGYSISELEGRTFLELVHPEDMESTLAAISRLELQEDILNFVNRYRCKDGTYRWIEWRSRNLGRQIYAAARDITERKTIEETLQKSEETFRNIVQASPMGIHLYQLQGNDMLVFIGANPAADKLLGVDNSQFVGKTIEQAFPSLHDTEIPDRYRRAARYGEQWRTEQIQYNEGSIAGAFEVYAFQISPNNTAVLFNDISDRKRAEKALLESEEFQRKLLQTVPDLIIRTDVEGMITFVNELAFTFMEQIPVESIYGRNIFSFVAEHDLSRAMENARERFERTVGPQEYQLRLDESTILDAEINGAIIRDLVADPVGMVYVIRDISERKRAEQERDKLQHQFLQAQKMESVGILAGGVAHDFNNLLQSMSVNIEFLLQGKRADHPESARLKNVARTIDRAAQLVRQLLLFSRKAESRKIPVNLNHEVEGVVRILERIIPKMIALDLYLDRAVWPLLADPVQIEQILLNLVNNSVDAMPDGGKLVIETNNVMLDEDFARNHPGSNVGRHVLLSVADTGCGMHNEILQHIFDPFFTTKEVGKGTGLGLASVYGIVKDHGGYIQCYSELGLGSTFRIYWPTVEQEDISPDNASQEILMQEGSETILVVDDDPEIKELTREVLESLGYVVYCAVSGEEALDIYQRHARGIDLVLLDLNMPGMGGQRCLQALLQLDPAVKVVIASGYTANGQARTALASGSYGFIGKPYQSRELAGMVREVLDRK